MFAQMLAEGQRLADPPTAASASIQPVAENGENSEANLAEGALGGDEVVFETDPRSRKARVKNSEALMALCRRHGKTLDRSNLRVCEGRKVVYLLAEGDITDTCCFFKESPTPSHRSKGSGTPSWVPPKEVTWNSVMIPNGWKVGVVVDGDPWTAETSVIDGCVKYRFTFVDQNGSEIDAKRSEWCETPGAAFKSLFCRVHPNKDVGRHNGKLYIGCHYDNVQDHLRSFFKKKKDAGAYDGEAKAQIKTLLDQWIRNDPLDVVTRKPFKRFVGTRRGGDSGEPQSHRKRGRRAEGQDVIEDEPVPNADALEDFIKSYMPDLQAFPLAPEDGNDRPSDTKRGAEAVLLRGERLSGPLPAVPGNKPSPEGVDEALVFVSTAHPDDSFTAREIFALVRLRLTKDHALAASDHVEFAPVAKLVADIARYRPTKEGDDSDMEAEASCTMQEFLRFQTAQELVLLRLVSAKLERLQECFEPLEREYGKQLKGTAIPAAWEQETKQTFNQVVDKTDLQSSFNMHVQDPFMSTNGLEKTALEGWSKLVSQILKLPLSADLEFPTGGRLLGARTLWDILKSRYLERFVTDLKNGLGADFNANIPAPWAPLAGTDMVDAEGHYE
jgi:hypothetical protein